MKRMHPGRQLRVFTDKYPLLGPLVYMLSVQYFAAQFVVAASWIQPRYSFSANVISDLGNTACGQYGSRFVCSPNHGLMNASFILLGLTMAVGSLFIYQEFHRTWVSLIGFSLMALGGFGTILVGLYPENVSSVMHGIGAALALGVGNVSLLVLACAIKQARFGFRVYTFVSGVISLLALLLFELHHYLGLGQGGMERIVSYPQTFWLVLFGVYMMATRYRARRRANA